MQRGTVSTSPVDEEDWRNGHSAQRPRHSPQQQPLEPPLRAPSLPSLFPLPPPHTISTLAAEQPPAAVTKQEGSAADADLPPLLHPHTNGLHTAPPASVSNDSSPRPYLIYSVHLPAEPVGVVDCSPLASLASLRHLLLDELVSELASPLFVFLYRGVKLTERQEQVKTVSNIAHRMDGGAAQADEAVYIRYTHDLTSAPPTALYQLPAGLPPLMNGPPSSARLSFEQLSQLEQLKLRTDTAKPPSAPAPLLGADGMPVKRKRGRPPKRRFDENGVEMSFEGAKRERLIAPPASHSTSLPHPPLTPPPPPTGSDVHMLAPAMQRAALDANGAPSTSPPSSSQSLTLLPLLESPTAVPPGSPRRRNRRTHAELIESWLLGDRGVKRCFTCGRVMTAGQQRQHRCDMEPEDRQARWRAERQAVMAGGLGGEVVIIGADGVATSAVVGGGGGGVAEKEDGRKSRWRKMRVAKLAPQLAAQNGGHAEAAEQKNDGTEHAEREAQDANGAQDEAQCDEDGEQHADGEHSGEHDSGDTEDEDDLDNLPPLLQAQEALNAMQAASAAVKMERDGSGGDGGDAVDLHRS